MLISSVVHPDCADEFGNIMANIAKLRKPIANILWAIFEISFFVCVDLD